ncbi:MAG: hypothetical protein V1743_08525, partial [Nanoarchaeota archaeon]
LDKLYMNVKGAKEIYAYEQNSWDSTLTTPALKRFIAAQYKGVDVRAFLTNKYGGTASNFKTNDQDYTEYFVRIADTADGIEQLQQIRLSS